MLLLLKASGVVRTPTFIHGHVRADGVSVKPHIARRAHKTAGAVPAEPVQPSLFDQPPVTPAQRLDAFISRHGGDEHLHGSLEAMTAEQRAKLVEAMAELGGTDAATVMKRLGMRRFEPEVIDFDVYAARAGASRFDIGDAGLHTRGHSSEATHQRKVAKQVEKDQALVRRRDDLRVEYDAKVAAGEIRPRTTAEILEHNSGGDGPAAQAARRVLEKRRARMEQSGSDQEVRAYHGTAADFDSFERGNEIGFHVGSTPEQANARSHIYGHDEGARTLVLNVRLGNVLEMPDLGSWYPPKVAAQMETQGVAPSGFAAQVLAAGGDPFDDSYAEPEQLKVMSEMVRAALIGAGYDTIRYENIVEGAGPSYLLLDPGQANPAFGGDPEFELAEDRQDLAEAMAQDPHSERTKSLLRRVAERHRMEEAAVGMPPLSPQ